MRWAYVKNGNATNQLREIGLPPANVPGAGPNAFLGDFLSRHYGEPMLVISAHRQKDGLRQGPLLARTFHKHINAQAGTVAKFLQRTAIFTSCLIALLRFRPDRILCGRRDFLLWSSYAASRLLGVPLVASRHGMLREKPSDKPVQRVIDALHLYVLRRASAIVCHGPFLKDQLVKRGIPAQKIHVFDVMLKNFSEDEKDDRPSPPLQGFENKYAVFAGRVERVKGVFDLLDAMTNRLREMDGPGLVYAGDGSALGDLRQTIRDRGLEDKAICLGRLPHERLRPLLRHAAVLVAPTRTAFLEGRCMSVMEGLAMRLPVVAPNFGPFPWLVRHGENGLLFEPDSAEDLRTKLDMILDDATYSGTLRQGAILTGQSLFENDTTFGQAVDRAFPETP